MDLDGAEDTPSQRLKAMLMYRSGLKDDRISG